MTPGYCRHKREPQTQPAFSPLRSAHRALQNGSSLIHGDAGPLILYAQIYLTPGGRKSDRNG